MKRKSSVRRSKPRKSSVRRSKPRKSSVRRSKPRKSSVRRSKPRKQTRRKSTRMKGGRPEESVYQVALEEATRLAGKTPVELKLETIEAQQAALDQIRLEQQRMLEKSLKEDELGGLPPMDPPLGGSDEEGLGGPYFDSGEAGLDEYYL